MDSRIRTYQVAADYIRQQIGGYTPLVGIVLGSGLGRLADRIQDPVVIPYKDIPGFPVSTAVGHKGNFIVGRLGGKIVMAMQGRFHYYEGYPMDLVTIGVRTMAVLGVQYLFVSNAAGAANPDYRVGDLVVIRDHISMFPNPLIGPNLDEMGPRFPDMTCAYDPDLKVLAEKCADAMGIQVRQGVYFGSTGPTYETPAEVRFYRMIGADLLGMSTVPEVIVARHCGLRVFGMSVVTNCANTDNVAKNFNDGDDVVKQADAAAERMTSLFASMNSRKQGKVAPFSVAPEAYGKFLCTVLDEWGRKDVGRKFVQLFEVTLGNMTRRPAGLCVHEAVCGHCGVIEKNGDLYRCDRYVFPEYRIGNILQNDLGAMMQTNRQFGEYKLDSLPRVCLHCDVANLCFGGCPKDRLDERLSLDTSVERSNYLCPGYRLFFRYFKQRIPKLVL